MTKQKRQAKNTVTPSKVASYDLYAKGMKQTEIAKKFNVSNVTVSKWIKSVTEFMSQSQEYQDAIASAKQEKEVCLALTRHWSLRAKRSNLKSIKM